MNTALTLQLTLTCPNTLSLLIRCLMCAGVCASCMCVPYTCHAHTHTHTHTTHTCTHTHHHHHHHYHHHHHHYHHLCRAGRVSSLGLGDTHTLKDAGPCLLACYLDKPHPLEAAVCLHTNRFPFGLQNFSNHNHNTMATTVNQTLQN